MSLRVLLVTHHWKSNSHHSHYGGYERLADFLPESVQPTLLTWGESDQELQQGRLQVMVRRASPGMRFLEKRRVLQQAASRLSGRYDLVHALYDDVAPLDCAVPLVSTFHTLKDLDTRSLWLKLRFSHQLKVMRKSDRVIALSENMRRLLARYTDDEKIRTIPHGVDTGYFHARTADVPEDLAALRKRHARIVLCIGNYGTSRRAIIAAAGACPETLFIVINAAWSIRNRDNLMFCKRVDEARLLALYRVSDILFRPLRFSSANNSILEAMATGLFVITTDTEGVHDYLDDSNSVYLETLDGLAEAIANAPPRDRQSAINADRFDWRLIAEQVAAVYNEMC